MQEVFRGAAGFSDPEKVNADVAGIYMCTYQMDCNETLILCDTYIYIYSRTIFLSKVIIRLM